MNKLIVCQNVAKIWGEKILAATFAWKSCVSSHFLFCATLIGALYTPNYVSFSKTQFSVHIAFPSLTSGKIFCRSKTWKPNLVWMTTSVFNKYNIRPPNIYLARGWFMWESAPPSMFPLWRKFMRHLCIYSIGEWSDQRYYVVKHILADLRLVHSCRAHWGFSFHHSQLLV